MVSLSNHICAGPHKRPILNLRQAQGEELGVILMLSLSKHEASLSFAAAAWYA
jgi:hypothetical protein